MDLLPVLLLTVLIVGYFVLAGCDIGLGMAAPRLARTPAERRRLVSAIAPYFLGTEVWLVAAIGVVAGLFPALKGVLLGGGGMWAVFTVLAFGWIMRDAGLWARARVDTDRWRSACDAALVGGSWTLAVCWGLAVGGLLSGGRPLTPFALACAAAVVALFLLRGAAFGAERLVPAGPSASAAGADEAARLTRLLARTALGAGLLAAVLAAVPFTGADLGRPWFALAAAAAVLAAVGATSGVSGPHLSRHTSALALGAVPVLVGTALVLPLDPAPPGTLVLVGAAVVPLLPLMVVGQVALYRMLRRPAPDHGFFVTPPPVPAGR
ncbi:cytochrome d ubiquinol oxidase subunit II [Nocardiopsis flavescens]